MSWNLKNIPGIYFTILFWMLIIGTMLQFVFFKYVISLDGPQHLHNAYVLKDLILNKGEVRDFYNINPLPVGYWTTHLTLTLFAFIFPPWLAEKLLLLVYVAGMALAFRYFLRGLNKDYNPIGAYLIFPLIPSMFLLHGYYAFSFGVMMLMITLGYWNRISQHANLKNLLKFSLLILLFYFTHGLVFTFFLFAFLVQYIHEQVIHLIEGENLKQDLLRSGGKTLKILLAFVPALIVLYIYSKSVFSGGSDAALAPLLIKDQLLHLFRITPLIGFIHEKEWLYTKPFSLALTLAIFSILIRQIIRLISGETSFRAILTDRTNIYLFIALFFLLLFMLNPDRFMDGSMSMRIGYFFFLFLVMWIPFQRVPALVSLLLGAVIIFAVVYNQTLMHKVYKPQVNIVTELQELDPYISDNASTFTLTESSNWLNGHFGLYIGLQNHTINLKNPQCYGPFPIVWDRENTSAFFAGDQQLNVSGLGRVDPEKYPPRQVDYIVVFFYDTFMKNESNEVWINILENEYHLVHLTSTRAAGLYARVN